ncbi:hypothetical protein GCM10009541_45870 [Micromonospora gifhornensis]|uniref:Flavin reductase n=1 Tax=Micromonospora gifhornensis TaxID=84594 RepID=A0ABQ4ICI0_9ACTN|nr:hypothetical protein Vgi01_23000 [Micromonospora gifhornensis]
MAEHVEQPPPPLPATEPAEHPPMRPLWLCRRCGQPWPCTQAKLALLADYASNPVGLRLYLAGCLCDAIDDLHRLSPSVTGSAVDMFDRFLGWPGQLARAYRVTRRSGGGPGRLSGDGSPGARSLPVPPPAVRERSEEGCGLDRDRPR